MASGVPLPCHAGHLSGFSGMAIAPSLGDARIPCQQWMSQCQCGDMVLLAHVREQNWLSLHRYGRPRMTEELQELELSVRHRHVGRLMSENGIKTLRTQKYKATTDPCTAGYAEHAREGGNHTFNIALSIAEQ
jgi:putative transposase